MKRLAVHTLALALALSCLLACGGGKDKIIPRGKLSRIYEELYLADRWADLKTEYRSQADTTDFYETVLESYGYTSADYRASVEYYLNDPERFSRILKKVSARLTAKSKDLGESANRIQEILEMLERAKDTAPQYKSLTDMSLDSLMRLVFDVPRYYVELPEEKTEPDSTLTGSAQADSVRTDSLKVSEAPVVSQQAQRRSVVQPGTRRIAEQ
jgi:hypothetical protein